ncbi:MAG: PRC-barrel domain containing protein [Rhodomicrobium sp.]|nr:PRC-barrel domain containing protein [Rhodomicrobium sp.]
MLATAATAILATGAVAQDKMDNKAQTGAPAATDNVTTSKTTTTAKQTQSVTFVSRVNDNQMTASELMGMKVRTMAGQEVGDINDIIVDGEGRPAVAIIGVGGFLGLGEKNVGVPYESVQFAMQNDERVASVDVTKATLETAPSFVYEDDKAASGAKVKSN